MPVRAHQPLDGVFGEDVLRNCGLPARDNERRAPSFALGQRGSAPRTRLISGDMGPRFREGD